MLQVLCQLLDTCNLEDVQTWLVSAAPAEKEKARTIINAALRGLKESERTSSNDAQDSVVDFDALSNFVEKQKTQEQYASQKYVNDTLNRSAPVLPSVDEHEQPEFGLEDTWNLSGVTSNYIYPETKKKRSHKQHQHTTDNDEQIDTIQLVDDRRRPRSTSLTGQSQNYDSPREGSLTGRQPNYPAESIQFNDDANNQSMNYVDDFSGDNAKSQKIQELQNKLSRQEEEAKRKFDELQTKQSRLENAIRLLAKQTAERKKGQKNGSGQSEDAPVVNVIIQSDGETTRRHKSSKPRATPFIHADSKAKTNREEKKGAKVGDYNVEDVKVQISLSRLDNQQPKTYGGVWKHDAQTLQRLQGC